MPFTSNRPRLQNGAGNTVLYLGLSALVIVVAAVAFLALRDTAEESGEQDRYAEQRQEQQARQAEPPAVKTVDLQDSAVEGPASAADEGSAQGEETADAGEPGLFERGGTARPLTDGLAGGSEAEGNGDAPQRAPNAVDFFDYGVLDGRVRIGVFGKGGIPDYKASVDPQLIVIRMPGEFRYVEEFSRTLQINQFGVSTARLERDGRGMRMLVTVTPALRHEPFLIEDPKGLMVAFEPRR